MDFLRTLTDLTIGLFCLVLWIGIIIVVTIEVHDFIKEHNELKTVKKRLDEEDF